jgi:hypothetical protein
MAGWILGRAIVRLIPDTLQAFPAALLWASAVLAVPVIALHDRAPSIANTVVVPWLCLQLGARCVAAGTHGIAEGSLAVSGSLSWWPLTHPRPR